MLFAAKSASLGAAQHAHLRIGNACPVLGHHRIGRRVVAAALGSPEPRASDGPEPPPLSLFVPFKSLPPNGQLAFTAEQECDVQVSNCKTVSYTYESQCDSCSGTGHARSLFSSRSRGGRRGGRGSLHTCLVCNGMGHVRRTTARYIPDIKGDIEHATLARQQRLPGEPTQQLAAPSHSDSLSSRWSRLRKAKDMFVKYVKTGSSQQPADSAAADTNGHVSPAAANGHGTAVSEVNQQPGDHSDVFTEPVASLSSNIVSSNGRLPTRSPAPASQGAAPDQQRREPVGKP